MPIADNKKKKKKWTSSGIETGVQNTVAESNFK